MIGGSLRTLAWLVALDVNRTIGGGYASMELLRRTFTARGWLDAGGHALLVAISRFTPGTNILAYCVLLGWRLRRSAGAAAALLAASLPSSLLIAGLAALLLRVDEYRAVRIALGVATLVAAWLVLAAAWHLLKPYLVRARWQRTTIVVVTAAVLAALDVTPVRIVLVAGVLGALVPPRGDA